MNNNVFKYIFAIVVVFLVGYTIYVIIQNKTDSSDVNLDHTSTLSNIQTDLRLSISQLDTINPLLTNNRNVQEVTKIIYDPLVTLNENYKLEYCLAEEIAKTDDVTYVIKLRKGVLWQDNNNFTADDVKFTIDLIKSGISPIYSENVRYIMDAEVVDSTTLRIVLTEPVAFFEYNLTFPIMCQKYYEGEDFATSTKVPTGTGMFKISEMGTNVIKLVPNETYWNSNNKPMATQVSINLYNNIGECYAAFKNGEIDILTVKINDIENYIGNLGYNKIEYKERDYDFITLNTANGIMSNQAVRKAISLAIDKNALVANCLGKGYTPSNFSLDMGNWLYTKDLNVSIDTEAAAQILNNDGWERTSNSWQRRTEDGIERLEFSLTVNTNNSARVAVAENIRDQLAGFAIPVTINYLSPENYNEVIANRNFDAAIIGIKLGYSPNLNTFFGDGNLANYSNDEVRELMSVISNTTDENVLYEKYNRLYDIYLEEAPYIGLYRNTNTIVYNQGLVGNITANSFNIFHNIEKWYRR